MKGDFSRITFDPLKHFTSVLMQQGRVQLDADWNEQAAILLWQIRTLARGVIGEFGGSDPNAFKVAYDAAKNELVVGSGLYFVHGIAVENAAPAHIPLDLKKSEPARLALSNAEPLTRSSLASAATPGAPAAATGAAGAAAPAATAPPPPPPPPTPRSPFDVWLAVWERLVTWLDDPAIRELALGDGIDTTVRTQVRWKIVVRGRDEKDSHSPDLPSLTVGLDGGVKSTDLCNISPDARYRGAGNQLYRVEIHNTWDSKNGASFKWSRENASLVYPVVKAEGTRLYLNTVGRDDRLAIHAGDYLEFESTDIAWTEALPLARVQLVNTDESYVTVDQVPDVFQVKTGNLAAVRRWDHSQLNSSGLTLVTEEKPISLESGLNVTFAKDSAKNCRRGDYWLIPARTGVAWEPPTDPLTAVRPPYYLAPLAAFTVDASGAVSDPQDRRSLFTSLAQPVK